jgi:hypothetical protein
VTVSILAALILAALGRPNADEQRFASGDTA